MSRSFKKFLRLLPKTTGLTLVEVMIALTVFSVGILAVANMQVVGIKSVTLAQTGMINTVAAGERIEQLLMAPYDDALLADTDQGFSLETPDHGPFPIDHSRSTIEWEVADDYPTVGTKRVSVTVRRLYSGGASGGQFTYEYVKSRDFR